MARILIVGGGCRGLALARRLGAEGHALRIVTRSERRRGAIEEAGAECFIGDPDRLVTLRSAIEHVTVACWLLATAGGEAGAVAQLHGSRLRQFLGSIVDSTVRGVVYESGGAALPAEVLSEGEGIVEEMGARNSIPVSFVRADPHDGERWADDALAAVRLLL